MYATRFSSERACRGAKKCVQFILRDEKNSYFTRIKLNLEKCTIESIHNNNGT